MKGFVAIRRGIAEHLHKGRLTVTEFAAYLQIILCADNRCGLWFGNAKLLAEALGSGGAGAVRAAQRLLSSLERKRYVRRFETQNKAAIMHPILVNRYDVRIGPGKGFRVDAEATEDWRRISCKNSKKTQIWLTLSHLCEHLVSHPEQQSIPVESLLYKQPKKERGRGSVAPSVAPQAPLETFSNEDCIFSSKGESAINSISLVEGFDFEVEVEKHTREEGRKRVESTTSSCSESAQASLLPVEYAYAGEHLKITVEQNAKLCAHYGPKVPLFYADMDLYLDTHPHRELKNHYAFARNWLAREKERGRLEHGPYRTHSHAAHGGQAQRVAERQHITNEALRRVFGDAAKVAGNLRGALPPKRD